MRISLGTCRVLGMGMLCASLILVFVFMINQWAIYVAAASPDKPTADSTTSTALGDHRSPLRAAVSPGAALVSWNDQASGTSIGPTPVIGANRPPQATTRSAPAYTVAGSSVFVDLENAEVTFQTVTASGATHLATSVPNPYRILPSGVVVVGPFFDISTTATYTDKLDVGVPYPASAISDPETLRMYHWTGSGWEDVTTKVDTTNGVIHGQVASLSWFFIGGEWIYMEDLPLFTSILVKTVAMVDSLTDVWVVVTAEPFAVGNCTVGETLSLEIEATDCGRDLWSNLELIMSESVVGWKYWMPALSKVVHAAVSTIVPPP